jgi:hypothetical protein
MHFLTIYFCISYRAVYSRRRDYELIADQAEEIPGDSRDTVENLTEAPNQGSEDLDPSALNPTQEGKPRT